MKCAYSNIQLDNEEIENNYFKTHLTRGKCWTYFNLPESTFHLPTNIYLLIVCTLKEQYI